MVIILCVYEVHFDTPVSAAQKEELTFQTANTSNIQDRAADGFIFVIWTQNWVNTICFLERIVVAKPTTIIFDMMGGNQLQVRHLKPQLNCQSDGFPPIYQINTLPTRVLQ